MEEFEFGSGPRDNLVLVLFVMLVILFSLSDGSTKQTFLGITLACAGFWLCGIGWVELLDYIKPRAMGSQREEHRWRLKSAGRLLMIGLLVLAVGCALLIPFFH